MRLCQVPVRHGTYHYREGQKYQSDIVHTITMKVNLDSFDVKVKAQIMTRGAYMQAPEELLAVASQLTFDTFDDDDDPHHSKSSLSLKQRDEQASCLEDYDSGWVLKDQESVGSKETESVDLIRRFPKNRRQLIIDGSLVAR
jgi:hypothetical protein